MPIPKITKILMAAGAVAVLFPGCTVFDAPGSPVSLMNDAQAVLSKVGRIGNQVASYAPEASKGGTEGQKLASGVNDDFEYETFRHVYMTETPEMFSPEAEVAQSLSNHLDNVERVRIITYYTEDTQLGIEAARQRGEAAKRYLENIGIPRSKIVMNTVQAIGFRDDTMDRYRHAVEIRCVRS